MSPEKKFFAFAMSCAACAYLGLATCMLVILDSIEQRLIFIACQCVGIIMTTTTILLFPTKRVFIKDIPDDIENCIHLADETTIDQPQSAKSVNKSVLNTNITTPERITSKAYAKGGWPARWPCPF